MKQSHWRTVREKVLTKITLEISIECKTKGKQTKQTKKKSVHKYYTPVD